MDQLAPVALRPALPADYDAIAEIWHAGASLPTVGPPIMPTPEQLRRRVDAEFDAGWKVTLAVRDHQIVGFIAITPQQAHVEELFIRPDALGGGIGQALLAHAMAKMPEGFTLFTRTGNSRARRFYEKAGLIALREDIHPRFGDAIIYYSWTP
jgi:ribosomal protein S18 acetylase RimI-like enzyme